MLCSSTTAVFDKCKRVGQWLSPNAAALVEVLLIARVASLSALRQQWEQQPRWLLPQILPWYADLMREMRHIIFVVSLFILNCNTERHHNRYSKAHREAIKRAWPPALDARAPVQVRMRMCCVVCVGQALISFDSLGLCCDVFGAVI